MGKKRKSIATGLDEVDRSMYASFCGAANSLSQLYTQAMNRQKLSFHAGEGHALEKLNQWIWRQQDGGSRVTTSDILGYVQNELEYGGEESSMSPAAPLQHMHSQPTIDFSNSSFPVFSGSSGANVLQATRTEHGNLMKNQNFQAGFSQYSGPPWGTGLQNNEATFVNKQCRGSNPHSSSDSFMDTY